MATTLLSKLYPTSTGLWPSLSEATPGPAVSASAQASDLARQVKRYSLSCMPMLGKIRTPVSWLDPLLNNDWIRGAVSLAVINISSQRFDEISERDLERTRLLINRIAGASEGEWPRPLKAFLIHSILSYIVAYRSPSYFQDSSASPHIFMLPTRVAGNFVFKACRFEKEVNICGGASVRIFVPVDGRGAPTYLFHGTKVWNTTGGSGTTLVDDFNPLGPGDDIRKVARRRLRALLEEQRERYGEAPIAIGHSQGAIVSTALAVDLPGLFSQVIAFSPTRPSLALGRKWRRQAKLSEELARFRSVYGKELTEQLTGALGQTNGSASYAVDRFIAGVLRGEVGKASQREDLLEEVRGLLDLKRDIGYGPVSDLPTQIDSVVSRYGDWVDPVSLLGDRWLGNVYEVSQKQGVFPPLRHLVPVATKLDFDIQELDVEGINSSLWHRTYVWQLAQRIAATAVYCILLPLLITKRVLLGWDSAYLMRYGIFGVPVQVVRHISGDISP